MTGAILRDNHHQRDDHKARTSIVSLGNGSWTDYGISFDATTTPNGTKSSTTEAVKGPTNDLIQVLDDEPLNQPEQSEERRHEIEDIFKHRVDYEEMTKHALGASCPRFPIGTSTSSLHFPCNFFEAYLWIAPPNIQKNKWHSWGSFERMSLLWSKLK
jgi:hypothetical protein